MEKLKKMHCNACGRALRIEDGILKEDIFEGGKEWGYFSRKDLEIHRFYLCETCYDRITGGFLIPPEIEDKKEIL